MKYDGCHGNNLGCFLEQCKKDTTVHYSSYHWTNSYCYITRLTCLYINFKWMRLHWENISRCTTLRCAIYEQCRPYLSDSQNISKLQDVARCSGRTLHVVIGGWVSLWDGNRFESITASNFLQRPVFPRSQHCPGFCVSAELYRPTLAKRKRPVAACRHNPLNLQFTVGAKQL